MEEQNSIQDCQPYAYPNQLLHSLYGFLSLIVYSDNIYIVNVLGTPKQIFLIIKSGIEYTMPENKMQIKIPFQKTLLNWKG
jgi:hypothetical protein